jgi:predicted GNAT family N-acyltransferase
MDSARASGTAVRLTTKADAEPIYKSFGFEVTGEIRIPDGPTLWPMWRDPPK